MELAADAAWSLMRAGQETTAAVLQPPPEVTSLP